MKKKMAKILAIGAVVLLAAGVALYFVHPLAPVLLLFSVVVQGMVAFGVMRAGFNGSYRQRAEERRRQFLKNGDAEKWLAGEEAEAAAAGYRYWSPAGKSLSALNRAEILLLLGRAEDAAGALAQALPDKLEKPDKKRAALLEARLLQGPPYPVQGVHTGEETP